jgi:hypothetical protein
VGAVGTLVLSSADKPEEELKPGRDLVVDATGGLSTFVLGYDLVVDATGGLSTFVLGYREAIY